MTGFIIAGGVVVVLLIVAVAVCRLLWYSVPYNEWVQYERERRHKKRRK